MKKHLGTKDIAASLFPFLNSNCEKEDLDVFLFWPPDLFSLTSRLLSATGAYVHIISPPKGKDWPPNHLFEADGKSEDKANLWMTKITEVADEWSSSLNGSDQIENLIEELHALCDVSGNFAGKLNDLKERFPACPEEIKTLWGYFLKTLADGRIGDASSFRNLYASARHNLTNDEFDDLWRSFEALMTLHAIADETCKSWGIHLSEIPEGARANVAANKWLKKNGTLSTVDNSRGRVLPKRHTPTVGIALRSTSSNLARHYSSVNVEWKMVSQETHSFVSRYPKTKDYLSKINDANINVLIIPYPFEVSSKDFKSVEGIRYPDSTCRFFDFAPVEEGEGAFRYLINGIIANAKTEVDKIDLVILPELSIPKGFLSVLEQCLSENEVSFFIAGVRQQPGEDSNFGANRICINFATSDGESLVFQSESRVFQDKHHRWKIDNHQITRYNLGGSLDVNGNWWEAINIPPRTVNFFSLGSAFTFCALICEDLARQDPIADLLRTVGPNLVVATLLDGPQLKARWSAKYASVLSEDPGSTVITLTSLGMVKRATTTKGKVSIALVSDGLGEKTEVTIDQNARGAILNLNFKRQTTSLADGRKDRGRTNRLVLAGVSQVD